MDYRKTGQNQNDVREGYIAWGKIFYSVDEFQLLLTQDCTQPDGQACCEDRYSHPGKPQGFGVKANPVF